MTPAHPSWERDSLFMIVEEEVATLEAFRSVGDYPKGGEEN